MARDAGCGIRRRARAEGVARASREAANRGETRAKGRADGPPLFCKSFLLETALAVDEPRPQTPDGGLFLAPAADVPAAFPADVWRRRSGTPVGHGACGGPRLLTLHGPLTLKTDCRISASLIHTC